MRSTPARGTEFTVFLPAVTSSLELVDSATNGVSAQCRTPATAGAAVLIVEDDPGVRAFTAQVLRDAGAVVFEAGNPAEALAFATSQSTPLDLLLTDVVLPGIDGADLAERLRALRPGLRVLFMSGYTPEEIAVTAALASDDVLLRKPFLPATLRDRVAQALAQVWL